MRGIQSRATMASIGPITTLSGAKGFSDCEDRGIIVQAGNLFSPPSHSSIGPLSSFNTPLKEKKKKTFFKQTFFCNAALFVGIDK